LDVRAEKKLWKEAAERAKVNHLQRWVDFQADCLAEVSQNRGNLKQEKYAISEDSGTEIPFVENRPEKSPVPGAQFVAKVTILPSVAEENESSEDMDAPMPVHTSAPLLRRVVPYSDLRKGESCAKSIFEFHPAEPMNPVTAVYGSDSIGSTATRLLELSGSANVSPADLPSLRNINGQNVALNSNFKNATSYQQPFSARIGASVVRLGR